MADLLVKKLTCEYRQHWLGTDVRKPRFSWHIQSDRRGTLQTAYRLQVAVGETGFRDLVWDSGEVRSEQSMHVEYGGAPLQSRTRYEYRVKVRDNFGRESDWSETDWYETALLTAEEWIAKWITPSADIIDPQDEAAFLLRKTFVLRGPVRSARIYASAAGVYEIELNGSRVGDDFMAPGWTSYTKRTQYQTYDVTAALTEEANGIGIALADGWYKGNLAWENHRNLFGDRRAALLQLHIRYEDGTEEVIGTDSTWSASQGPIRYAEIYHGETYDARLERQGWSQAGFDDSAWSAAETLDLPFSTLVAQENWPSRVTEVLKPISLIRTPRGETVLDMGQNMVGRIRFSVEAPAGTEIRLQHAEVLDREGNFYIGNLRTAKQTVTYIARGEGVETYAPHFSFQGFRYVKVEGYPGQEHGLPLERFEGEVIHSDMEPTGEFECSNEMVNQLQRNIVWGQRGNFLDVPTDCPQRDERLGWTGDAQVFVRTAAFNYQVAPFFTKWLRDLRADQLPNGGVPFVVPHVLDENAYSSSAWGDAAVICPWTMYLTYGDKRLLAEQYDSMKAWVEYIRSQGDQEYLWNTGFHFGDWLGLDAKENSYVGATPRELIATAFYAHSTRLLRDAAVVLGYAEEVRRYSELLERVKQAFRDEFVTPAGRVAAPTQTAHALALMFGLVEGAAKERAARDLNELVVQNEYHLTTGFVGTPYLCHVLSEHGYHDTSVKLLLQQSYPSWLYSITQGATTIWEHWDGIKPDGSFWSDDMNSYNHYAYGAIGEWLYRTVAGLDLDESGPAFKRIRIEPRFADGELMSARASLITPYGRAESSWRIENGKTKLAVEVPVNAAAQVLLRGAALEDVRENGAELTAVQGIGEYKQTPEGVRLTIGSGTYSFTW
ncbi:alpha-L-rhamnosidase [Cohnella lubricantis]|uniref:alpha-L-rhamnosidase n=1 Tax=Cohnella lubricantis TaxID=2163172 RepID=A0A841TBY9_9BACL|nr:alpha-L-rhamnosidase [Cohnella lubricantis]MBB6676888.1 family 78 glycoside hydrolase catalytic domain [Cohnella lubricantis]MBP2118288.1 alpha-L-rhamnosidase [Cohnella lubricantis]